jgi:hypothetical protein
MSVAEYSLLLINPAIERLDTVVVGALFRREGRWDVRVAASVAKMQAINPSFPQSKLLHTSQLAEELVSTYGEIARLREYLESARLGVTVDRFVGRFTYESEAEYQHQVRAVLSESVNPPTFAQSNAAPVSRRRNVVRRNLRQHFKARGLWSRRDHDIAQHKVVESFPVSEDHGIFAEFALRNGAMHITETIDFEMQSLKDKRLSAQAKAFVLTESQRVFGDDTQRYVVTAGGDRDDARLSVHLLRDFATRMFALESHDDMREYVDLIAAAAGSAQQSLP